MQVLLLTACMAMCACAAGQRAGELPDLADRADLAGFIDPGDLKTPDDLAMACTLKINEVQTDGAAGGTDEFIELLNPCTDQVLLTGYKITYRAATNATANDSGTIATLTGFFAPHTYYLVANTGYPGAADIKPYNGSISGLAQAGASIGLRDPNGVLLDSVGWGTANTPFVEGMAAPVVASAHSIARKPDGTDTNNNKNYFVDSTPTPKASN